MKYRFAYSGNREFYRDFKTIKELRYYLKVVPEWELKNSVVIKWKNKIAYVGAFVRNEKMVDFTS